MCYFSFNQKNNTLIHIYSYKVCEVAKETFRNFFKILLFEPATTFINLSSDYNSAFS